MRERRGFLYLLLHFLAYFRELPGMEHNDLQTQSRIGARDGKTNLNW
jgi:hypothetical protein